MPLSATADSRYGKSAVGHNRTRGVSLGRQLPRRHGGIFEPVADMPHHKNYRQQANEDNNMKSLILWICGVPISVIILLKVFGVF